MRRILVAFAVLTVLLVPASASAHPLGNFTVNRFTAVELSGRDVYVHYVLDLAEIPTVQEGDRVRAAGFDAQVASRLDLDLDGRRAQLVPADHKVSERPGAAGLPTLRFEAVYRVVDPGTPDSLELHGLCDRVVVFSRGEVVATLEGDAVGEADITGAALTASKTRERSTGRLPRAVELRRFLAGDYAASIVLAAPNDESVSSAVRSEVEALCRKFPLYPEA